MNKRYLFFIALSLCCGGIVAGFAIINGRAIYIICGAVMLLAAVILSAVMIVKWLKGSGNHKILSYKFLVIFSIAAMFMGAGTVEFAFERESLESDLTFKADIIARVSNIDYNDEYADIIAQPIDVKTLKDVEIEINGNLFIRLYFSEIGQDEVKVGDNIALRGDMTPYSLIYSNGIDGYRYVHDIKYYMQIYGDDAHFYSGEQTFFEGIREKIAEILRENMGEQEFSIAYGMLVGETAFMEIETLDSYRKVGMGHIFAVSGLHVGFIVAALAFILKRLKLNTIIRFFIISLALIFYNMICGFSPSVLRASVMFGVMLLAGCFGVKYDSLTAISLSFILLFIVSPLSIFYAGTMMSYGTVAVIILLSPVLTRAFKRVMPKFIASSAGVAVSAQLGITPLSMIYFSNVSLVSLVINMLLIPVFSAIFYILVAGVSLAFIAGWLGKLLIVSDMALRCVNYIVDFAAVFKYAQVTLYTVFFSFIIYYLYLFFVSDTVMMKAKLKRSMSLALLAVFLLSSIAVEFIPMYDNRIHIFKNSYDRNTYVSSHGENALICDSDYGGVANREVLSLLGMYRIKKLDNVIINSASEGVIDNLKVLKSYADIGRIYIPFHEKMGFLYAWLSENGYDVDIIYQSFEVKSHGRFEFKFLNDGGIYAVDVAFQDGSYMQLSRMGAEKLQNVFNYFEGREIIIANGGAHRLLEFYRPIKFYSYKIESYVQSLAYDDIYTHGDISLRTG